MGAEGGVAWVTLRSGGDRDEVLRLLSLVGISPDTNHGRQAVRDWVRSEGPGEVGLGENDIPDEWNTCIPWQGLRELCDIWEEMSLLESGEHTESYVGLGQGSTLGDIFLESLTSSLGQDYTKNILRGFKEAHWTTLDILEDPEYLVTVGEWCEGVRKNLVFSHAYYGGGQEPKVSHHEIWT